MSPKIKENKKILYTIGHSTHPIEEFIELLKAHNIERVVDVRTIPKSHHNPQFNEDVIEVSLKKAGINYVHITELGGLRHTTATSKNIGWHNKSFRGYADYMETPGFEKGLHKLEKIAKKETTAIMCAEAVPWRCHRSMIADALTVQKWDVFDIMTEVGS